MESEKLNSVVYEYERDLFIDDSSLDLDCIDQPMLFMKYAKEAAETRRSLDLEKEKLDVAKAEVDKAIRMNPYAYGIEKVTEGAISSAILTDAKYQRAYKHYLDLKYDYNMARNAVKAFNQRKDMLEALIKLHGQQYFAGPRVPRDLTKERELKQKKVSGNIVSKSGLKRNK